MWLSVGCQLTKFLIRVRKMNQEILVLVTLFCYATCLIRVRCIISLLLIIKISDPQLAGDYAESNLNLYPRQFLITASLVVADPFDGCSPPTNNVSGKIVIVQESKSFQSKLV
jgi:hypothetical protein